MIGLILAAGLSGTSAATPANIEAVLATAPAGSTIVLSAGTYPRITIYNLAPGAPVTIDARAAKIGVIAFSNASNWTVQNGDIGAGAKYVAVQVIGSDHLAFKDNNIHDYGTAGITTLDSHDITISGNTFARSGGDGVDLVSTQGVVETGNTCQELTYTADVHSDCTQMWNKPGDPQIVSNVLISGNRASGHMQGWDNFGAGDPRPMENVIITDNVISTDMTWAGNLSNCRHCKMKGNSAHTLPGMHPGWRPPSWVLNDDEPGGNVKGERP